MTPLAMEAKMLSIMFLSSVTSASVRHERGKQAGVVNRPMAAWLPKATSKSRSDSVKMPVRMRLSV